jgi:hypothetical protein
VLVGVGTKVLAAGWTGSEGLLGEVHEKSEQEKCRDQPFKVMDFGGQQTSTVRVKSFLSMPKSDITVAAWINGHAGTPVSYGVKEAPDTFVLSNPEALEVYLLGEVTETNVKIAGVGWVHVAVTWSSEEGDLTVYLNGHEKFTKTNVAKGKSFTPGGCFMVGQQQGQNCQATPGKSFFGRITNVEVFGEALASQRINRLMVHPVPERVIKEAGSNDPPNPHPNLKLALLTRQYASEELSVSSPALCALEDFRHPPRSHWQGGAVGTMEFSVSGGGHYKNFASCHFDDQGIGEWVAVDIKEKYAGAAPLKIQYRTSPQNSKCPWCQNGQIAYIDGCAVQYGEDKASIGFGGFREQNRYTPHGSMNSKTHHGWKSSTSKALEVNFGKGATYMKTFEVKVNDGTYIKCAPRSMYVSLPKKYKGKIAGVAGVGTAGSDWAAGPNTAACPECKAGEPVEGTNGACHAESVSDMPADPMNGNSGTKPVAKFLKSWQVDGTIVPSIFAYTGSQKAGSFNENDGEKIKPPLEVKSNAQGEAEAKKACQTFESAGSMKKCIYDFKMVGEDAVANTLEDLQQAQESRVIQPSESMVRDMSRYKNKAEWVDSAQWQCMTHLQTAITDLKQSILDAQNSITRSVTPIEGSRVVIYLDQEHAKTLGVTKELEGLLDFSKIQIFSEDGPVMPQKIEMSSTAHPEHKFVGMNCLDDNKDTDCRTSDSEVATITLIMPTKIKFSKIILVDTLDKTAGPQWRNLGAYLMITDSEGHSNPLWQSEPIRKHQLQYEFEPQMKFQTFNYTGTLDTYFQNWDFTSPFTKLEPGKITIPAANMIRTRQQFSPQDYILIKTDLQKLGPGAVQLQLFSPNCRPDSGVAMMLGHAGEEVAYRFGSIVVPVFGVTTSATVKNNVAFELMNGVIRLYLNGKKIQEQALRGADWKTGGLCITSPESKAVVSDMEIRLKAPVGQEAEKVAADKHQEFLKKIAQSVKRAKLKYKKALSDTEKYFKEKQTKAANAARQKEKRELDQKAEAQRALEAKHKAYVMECAERKEKAEEKAALEKRIKGLVETRSKLLTKSQAMDSAVSQDAVALRLAKANIEHSQVNLAKIDSTIGAAKANVSAAFTAARDSLQLYKAHVSAAGDVGGSATTEHEEYLKQVAGLRAMHSSRAASINLLHDSRIAKNDLVKTLGEKLAKDKEIKKELTQTNMLLESLGWTANEQAKESKKEAAEVKDSEPKKPHAEMGFSDLVNSLKQTSDADEAFDLVLSLEEKANKGDSSLTDAEKLKQEQELATAELELAKESPKVTALRKADSNPEVVKAEQAVSAAQNSGDEKALEKANEQLKQALTPDFSKKETANKIQVLEAALATAKAAGDKPRVEAAQKMLTSAKNALNPATLDAKQAEIEAALKQAMKDCDHDENNPKVQSLMKALQEVKEQAKAEANGKEIDTMIAQAVAAKSGGIVAQNTTRAPPRDAPPPKEEPNSAVVKIQGEIQAAKDKGDEKAVAQLGKELTREESDQAEAAGKAVGA